jgi:hypothetical protein
VAHGVQPVRITRTNRRRFAMSMNPPNWENACAPPPKPGMSGASKLLVGLGIGCLVVVLLCGGVAGVGFWYLKSTVENAMSQDPAVVAANAAKIAQVDMPPGFKPKMSMDMSIAQMLFVVYDDSPNNAVTLVQFGPMFANAKREDLQRRVDDSLRQQGMNRDQATETAETKTVVISIRGGDVPFQITTIKDGQGKPIRLQALGTFPTTGGTGMITVNVDPAKHNEEAVLKMLRSIR